MGLLFVLIFWVGFGAVFAAIGGIIAAKVATHLTRKADVPQTKLVAQAALFPLYCVLWTTVVFIFQATVNGVYFHRDIGIGDSSRCIFSNGYGLLMVDVSDQGILYNPKTQNDENGVASTKDTVDYVRTLQIAGRYILGASGSQKHWPDRGPIDLWFILDTAIGTHTSFASYDSMKAAAEHLNIQPRLRPIFEVYSENRFGWFDGVTLALLIIPPLIALLGFLRQVIKHRKRGYPVPQPA